MRLSRSSITELPTEIKVPQFAIETLRPGILHLGIGAFHRAHMAYYTQQALHADPANADWGIRGVSFRSSNIRYQLRSQDFLYTHAARQNDEESLEIIGAVRGVIFTDDDASACPAHIADTDTKIVSMTITEKGYCHDPATGELDESHPAIISDLETANQPSTPIGAIVRGLQLRKVKGALPVTLLSCDNLPSNGAVLERIVRRYAEIYDPSLMSWIDDNVSFPKCMVDRIVPATTDQDRDYIENRLELRDEAPVVAEAFSQWVIEDKFSAGRPSWEEVGVEIVSEVEGYETMKLRLLNGPHSASAYLGYLAGFETVGELVAEPIFRTFLRRMMDEEIHPGLTVPPGVDIEAYKTSVLDRFSNRALSHRTWQIAMDGSQKLPQRLLGSIRSALENNLPIECLSLGIAAWMRYVLGIDEHGRPIDVSDPLAATLKNISSMAQENPRTTIERFFEIEEIFGNDLYKVGALKASLSQALESLYQHGAARSVARYARK